MNALGDLATTPLPPRQGARLLGDLAREADGWPMCGKVPVDTVRNILARVAISHEGAAAREVLSRFNSAFVNRGGYLTPQQLEQFAVAPLRAAFSR